MKEFEIIGAQHKVNVDRFNAWLRYRLSEFGVSIETKQRIFKLLAEWRKCYIKESVKSAEKKILDYAALQKRNEKWYAEI